MTGVGRFRECAFLSYAREDKDRADWLQHVLETAGIPVWRDLRELEPGQDWQLGIRAAIRDHAVAFVACFSRVSVSRASGYQNEELLVAVAEFRRRQPGRPWLIPVRFDDCQMPCVDLGGGRDLRSLQRADLFGTRHEEETAKLIAAVSRIFRPAGNPAMSGTVQIPASQPPVAHGCREPERSRAQPGRFAATPAQRVPLQNTPGSSGRTQRRRTEADEFQEALGEVATASAFAALLASARRSADRDPLELSAASDPAGIRAVGSGNLIPDRRLLGTYLAAVGIDPCGVKAWHQALDTVQASVRVIEYRARAIDLARAASQELRTERRQSQIPAWARPLIQARTGLRDPGGVSRTSHHGHLAGEARSLLHDLAELDERHPRVTGDLFSRPAWNTVLRHYHGRGLSNLQKFATGLVSRLAAIHVDASGMNLAGLAITNLDAAIGVTWTAHTRWPVSIADQISQRYQDLGNGTFQIN